MRWAEREAKLRVDHGEPVRAAHAESGPVRPHRGVGREEIRPSPQPTGTVGGQEEAVASHVGQSRAKTMADRDSRIGADGCRGCATGPLATLGWPSLSAILLLPMWTSAQYTLLQPAFALSPRPPRQGGHLHPPYALRRARLEQHQQVRVSAVSSQR